MIQRIANPETSQRPHPKMVQPQPNHPLTAAKHRLRAAATQSRTEHPIAGPVSAMTEQAIDAADQFMAKHGPRQKPFAWLAGSAALGFVLTRNAKVRSMLVKSAAEGAAMFMQR